MTHTRLPRLILSHTGPEHVEMGNRISNRIRKFGHTTQSVAEHVGVTEATVKKWRAGETKPQMEMLRALAWMLRTNVEWLRHGTGDANAVQHVATYREHKARAAQLSYDRSTFAGRLNARMATMQMANDELAGLADVPLEAVRSWRMGGRLPSGANLQRIARVLKTNPLWLRDGGARNKPEDVPAVEPVQPPIEALQFQRAPEVGQATKRRRDAPPLPTKGLAGRLNAIMEARRLSLLDVALVIHTSPETVSHWRYGRMVPRRANLHTLADALGVDRDWLEHGDDTVVAPAMPTFDATGWAE
jgi:transcriptional regulator with XRE-family HTH domain